MRSGFRWIARTDLVMGVEGNGGGNVVSETEVVKKAFSVGPVRMCRRGRRG